MNKFFKITILLLTLGFSASAQEALLDSANQNYINQNYNKAIEQYLEVLSGDKVSAELYYNLGNAYYKKGDYTQSILNYERAKRLAPNDEDIQFNLNMANAHIVDDIQPLPQVFFVDWWHGLINTFTVNEWAWVSCVSFLLFLIGFCIYLFSSTSRNKRLGFTFGVLSVLISILSFNFAASHKKELNKHRQAIIIQPTVTVKSSPSEGGTSLFIIHEGLKVEIREELGDWLEVRLDDGNQGWLQANSLERI
ncbi:MAG: tetratricopeptide repeat protein [Mangrovibacterium sp.]